MKPPPRSVRSGTTPAQPRKPPPEPDPERERAIRRALRKARPTSRDGRPDPDRSGQRFPGGGKRWPNQW